MRLKLEMWPKSWPMRETLHIARGAFSEQPTLQVRLTSSDGIAARGEACGIPYKGETPATIMAELESVRDRIEAGLTREDLFDLLPKGGGARMAIDAALWDLEAKSGGQSPYAAYGLTPRPIASAYTIGIRALAAYEETASRLKDFALLKIKVNADDPIGAIQAVRRGAPEPRLVLDTNQSWTVDDLKRYADALVDLRVDLIEQPIRVGDEPGLDGWASPIPLCADELIDGVDDLSRAEGRFDVINIKLDKAGGLTAAMRLGDAAIARGMKLMVGCMVGSSLSMAPAMVLAHRCTFVDLDGPMLQAEDVEHGYEYQNGVVAAPHKPALWG